MDQFGSENWGFCEEHLNLFLRLKKQQMKITLLKCASFAAGVTMRMKGLLERKLGRVMDTNTKSRQLLVRGIDDETTEDEIKDKLTLESEDIESVEINNDSLESVVFCHGMIWNPFFIWTQSIF